METPRNPGAPGCSWQVVAMLPLCLDLYLQDFDAAGQQRLRDLCAGIPGNVLPPLRRPQPGLPFALGTPFDCAELVRANGNPNRTDHYEQVGLFIAGKCGLLIAVMDRDEQPAGIGKRSLDSRAPPEAAGTGGGRMRFRHICDANDVDRPSPGRPAAVSRASAPICKGPRCAKFPAERGASAMRSNRPLAMTAAALCLSSCSSVLPLGDQTATRTASDDAACQASAAQPGAPPCPPPKEPPPGGCGACDRMGQ